MCDPEFAQVILSRFVGKQKQMPPAYSAIKKGGVKACDAARKGNVIALEPRDIEVYSAELLDLERDPRADSDGGMCVSRCRRAHIFARSLVTWARHAKARRCAHVETLRRTRAGVLDVEDCLSLDALERYGVEAAIDPVFLLESRMAFLDDEAYADVCNGKPLRASDFPYMKRRTVLMPTIAVRGDAPFLRRVRFTMASSCAGVWQRFEGTLRLRRENW